MNNIRKLNKLLQAINILFSIGDYGVNHVEFLFLDVKRLLEEHSHVKKYFFNKLMENVGEDNCLQVMPSGYIDSDLLCYLAHATRWKEFYDFATYRKNFIGEYPKNRWSEDIADDILKALQDNWEDAEFYNNL